MMSPVTLIKDGKRLGILESVPDDVQAVVWGGTVWVRSISPIDTFVAVQSYHTNQELKPEAPTKKVSIYDALKAKLGREPKYTEVKEEFDRIKAEVLTDLASQGKLPHQRKRKS